MTESVEFGIDLGTTNSCVTRWEKGGVRVFQNNDHMNVTPSAVHILKSGRVIVGRRAHAAINTDPANVAIEFKRWMGQKDRKIFPAAQRELSAEELSAEVLKSLREDVRRQAGTSVKTAVVTVPAAFGALQCEATARAAKLSGLEEAPLLQEPIAAALGYGLKPDTSDQRWMVFDLGGGTLDVAIVSTRDGRLNVLEHRGDNLMGGKDIDQAIVQHLLLPSLERNYDLRASGPSTAKAALLPHLRIKAEEAKIDLSTEEQVSVALFDVGQDSAGNQIDMEVQFSRSDLEVLIEPLFRKCCDLAQEALLGARLRGADLDRILLVGGPTQTPLLRSMLNSRFGTSVDFSVDPMTVVGQGAAVYASTLERTKPAAVAGNAITNGGGSAVNVKLAYEPVSSDLQPTVAGRIKSNSDLEIRIDVEDGFWTSGWTRLHNGLFELPVSLKENDITTFWLYARDTQGELVATDVTEFEIRHGLVPSAPPLPHSLSVEIISPGEKAKLDPIFSKGAPLPAERRVRYRAARTLIPDNPNTNLAIKLWEGEYFGDPEANEWVGHVVLPSSDVRRSIPEGAEIEVVISIDASRLINVEAFVPHLNQSFSSKLYVPQREERDYSNLSVSVATDAHIYRQRLDELERGLIDREDNQISNEIGDLRRTVDEIESAAPSSNRSAEKMDPDEARRLVEKSKFVRGQIGRIEDRAANSERMAANSNFVKEVESTEGVIGAFGTTLEKQQLTMFRRELERALTKNDNRAAQRARDEIVGMRWRVLGRQDWFWKEMFDVIRNSNGPFSDVAEARNLIKKGEAAVVSGDGDSLRSVVRALWKLQPKSETEIMQERALKSGLRKY
jgi:molecular chaperone DnaK